MAIKQIVVHPKGATHIQKLVDINYWMKQVEGVWLFFGMSSRSWLPAAEGSDRWVSPIHQVR